jgi:hypothetical protein
VVSPEIICSVYERLSVPKKAHEIKLIRAPSAEQCRDGTGAHAKMDSTNRA